SPASTWSSRKPRSSKIGFRNTPKGAGRKATRLFFSAITDEKRRSRFRGGVFVPGVDRSARRYEEPTDVPAGPPTPRPRRCGGPEHHGVTLSPSGETKCMKKALRRSNRKAMKTCFRRRSEEHTSELQSREK